MDSPPADAFAVFHHVVRQRELPLRTLADHVTRQVWYIHVW